MRYDTPRASRREDEPRPRLWPVVIVALAMLVALGAVARMAVGEAGPRPVPLTTAAYGGIRVYAVTDPVTGVEYLVTDRGGICRREGADE